MRIEKLSRKQFEIFAFAVSDIPFLICDGAVRSGKTVCMVSAFVIWAMDKFDRCNFAICGKTVANAERNVLSPLLTVEDLPYRMRYNRAERKMICRCGGRENYFYLFGGKDESSYTLIQGITLAGVLLDEVALMPRSFVEQAMARTLTYSNAKIWFNCNPESPLHWFNQEWIIPTDAGERNVKHLHFLMTDNPILGPEEIQKAEAMFSGVFYDRYIRGLWVAAEGLVYPMFGPGCITDEVPGSGLYYVSIDYGTLNPFSAGLWRVTHKKAVRIREFYYDGRKKMHQKTDEEYYRDIESLVGDLPVEQVIIDPSAASMIEVMRRHGRFSVRKAKNDVLPGIMTVARFLQNGKLKIHSCCKDAIREFGLYRWDENASEDRPIKESDHAMDDIRYMCFTVLRYRLNDDENVLRSGML